MGHSEKKIFNKHFQGANSELKFSIFSKENTLNSEEWPNLEKSFECYGPSFSSSNFNCFWITNIMWAPPREGGVGVVQLLQTLLFQGHVHAAGDEAFAVHMMLRQLLRKMVVWGRLCPFDFCCFWLDLDLFQSILTSWFLYAIASDRVGHLVADLNLTWLIALSHRRFWTPTPTPKNCLYFAPFLHLESFPGKCI